MKWTKAFRKAHGKELTVDSTFEFERLRHRPIKYNRDLMAKTIQAMQRVAEIRAAREKRFWAERMKDNVKKQKAAALRELEQNPELAKPLQEDVTRKSQLVQGTQTKYHTRNGMEMHCMRAIDAQAVCSFVCSLSLSLSARVAKAKTAVQRTAAKAAKQSSGDAADIDVE